MKKIRKIISKTATKILLGGILIAVTAGVFIANQKAADVPVTKEKISRAQHYQISSTERPEFQELIIDPFDPKIGEKQLITVRVRNDTKIESIEVDIKTDNTEKTYRLTLAEGTDLDGIWKGEWKLSDTYETIYRATLRGVSEKSNSKVELIFK